MMVTTILTVNQQNTVAGKVQVGPFSAERKVVDGKTTDTLAANKDLPILGQTVKASLKVLFVNEVLNKVHLSASLTKELTLEMLNNMLFGDEGWITATKNAVVGGIESLNQQIDNPLLKSVAGKLRVFTHISSRCLFEFCRRANRRHCQKQR